MSRVSHLCQEPDRDLRLPPPQPTRSQNMPEDGNFLPDGRLDTVSIDVSGVWWQACSGSLWDIILLPALKHHESARA
eukprot:366585-Pyramimonas_sp.AAC.1